LLAAALAATVGITAAPARGATTLRGRILGRPHVEGVHARVPVVLDARSARMLHARSAEAVLTVPARSGFRSIDRGRGTPDATRLGDIISARVRGLGPGGAARARYLKIERRSAAPSFAALAARLGASAAGARRASDEVGRIAAAEQSGPQDPAQLRTYLLGVRYQLNLLIADLRAQRDAFGAVVAGVRDLPGGGELVDRLAAAADAAGAAAQRLEDGVTGLDEFINSIGGPSGPALPVGSVSEVGALLDAAQKLLDGLGAPATPGPVQGLPLPVP
jgi:hypothetical protein